MQRSRQPTALCLTGALMASLLLRGTPPRVHADDQTPAGERGDPKPVTVNSEVWVVLASVTTTLNPRATPMPTLALAPACRPSTSMIA